MNGIDPKFTFWFGVWTNVLTLIAGYGVEHAPAFVAQYAPAVQWFASLAAQANSVVLTALIGVSSTRAGPLVNVPAGVVKPLVLLAVLIVGLFAFAGDASAQGGIKVRLPDPLNLNKPSAAPTPAPKAATGDPLTRFINDLEAIKQEVVDGIVADFNAADADAGLLLNASDPASFKDPISHACYPAAVRFLQSLPVAQPTTGKYILVQLFQKKRDFVAQIRAGIPVYLKLGCAPLIGDEAAIFAKLMGLIGVKVGLDALVPGLGFALPTL